MIAVKLGLIDSTSSSSRTHLALRLSLALLMITTMLAGSGDAIDLMKLLDQKHRSFKRAGMLFFFFAPLFILRDIETCIA